MELILLPTMKCAYNCDYCYIDTIKQDRKIELPLSSRLFDILDLYTDVSLNGGEPLLHSHLNDLLKVAKNIKQINTSFLANPKQIEGILDIREVGFNITYQGLSNYRRQHNDKVRENIDIFDKNVNSLRYMFFVQNFKNIEKDLEHIQNLNKNVEVIFYYDKSDLSFIDHLSNQDKIYLKNIINKTFDKDCFNRRSLSNKKNIHYLGPYDLNIYFSRQTINRDNCKNCYTLTSEHDTCQNCLSYANAAEFSFENKNNFINSFESFKNSLKMQENESE